MLELHGVCAGYARARVLDCLSARVLPHAVTALLGANGAGKTTLLRAISGIVKPSSGRIVFDGRDITGLAPHTTARMGIAHVLQGRRIFTDLTVRENLDAAHHMARGSQQRQDPVAYVLGLFPALERKLPLPAAAISGGEQQMLAIGCALLTRPRFLMIDELSLGLAPKVADSILQTLTHLCAEERLTILMVEQDADKALKAASNVLVMRLGRMQVESSTREFDRSVLLESYLS